MKLPVTLALAALVGTGPVFADPPARLTRSITR